MMKQNKWNKILIPAVLLIWGGVILQFFGNGGDPLEKPAEVNPIQSFSVMAQERAAFELSLDYRDPFLNKLPKRTSTRKSQSSASRPRLVAIPPPKPPLVLPEFHFQGGVQSSDGSLTGLLSVDGKIIPIHQGEQVADFTIEKMSLEAITLIHPDTTLILQKR